MLAWHRSSQEVSDVLYQRVLADQFAHRGGTSVQTVGTGLSLSFPTVAANADGDWVIAWEEASTFEHLGHDIGIRAFRASGEPATPVIRIESSGLEQSLIQISDTGRIFATWIAEGEVTTPGGATHRPVVGRIWQLEE